MRVSRNTSILLNYVVNELLPPWIRDSRWLMFPLFKLAFGDKARIFLDFRERAFFMTDREYRQCYVEIQDSRMVAGSDLNRECLDRIPREVLGETVLEVGCGRGLLASRLAERFRVTASDIVAPASLGSSERLTFVDADAEDLPFDDNSFDTVVCTHVLEHVRDVDAALSELRRVALRRIVIVVPRERSYRFGFNLHLTFFPYRFSVLNVIGKAHGDNSIRLELEGGDWFYVEDLESGTDGSLQATRG